MIRIFVVFLLVFLSSFLLFGCSSKSDDGGELPNSNVDNFGSVSDGLVVRSFSSSNPSVGDVLVVTVTKNIKPAQTTLLVEDFFPSGWEVVDAGSGVVVDNAIRWAELTNAKSGSFVYTLRAGSSEGVWRGRYSVMGRSPADIIGDNVIVVE